MLVLGGFMKHSWAQVASACVTAWQGSRMLGAAVFGPPFALLLEAVVLLYQYCLPILQVLLETF